MLRLFYRWLLGFHPARFRERFVEEMLSVFDHVEGRAATAETRGGRVHLARATVDDALGILGRKSECERTSQCRRFSRLLYLGEFQASKKRLDWGSSSDMDCVLRSVSRS
jgi:hypothetical protein